MNKLRMFILGVMLISSSAAMAVDSAELIEARQGLMTLYAVNMDVLGEMVRRKQPYSKSKAKAAADNLLALARLNVNELWPTGTSSDSDSLGSKTSAKPELWIYQEKVIQHQKDLVAALEILARDAGWSVRSLEDSIGAVENACKRCHKEFRAKK